MTERGGDVARAAAVLSAGGLVAFPTETVYGLGADASSEDAVARIFAVKGRPRAHPLIVHLAPEAPARRLGDRGPGAARRLAAAAWPGPLTMILRRGPRVARRDDRRRRHRRACACRRIRWRRRCCARSAAAIAAPSANRFGAVSPTTADHVVADLGDDVDYVLDGGACEVGVESTIVDLSRGRAGAAAARADCRARRSRRSSGPLAAADARAPAAPGTLASHYAPRAEVIAVAPRRGAGGGRGGAAGAGRGARAGVARSRAWPELRAHRAPAPR